MVAPRASERIVMEAESHGSAQDGVEGALQKALRFGKRVLPLSLAGWLSPVGDGPAVGGVQFGDLAGTAPIDGSFGYGRGTPIDRFYIESFLDRNRNDIAGRVLEIGDATYSRRFGAERVTRQDVLHLRTGHRLATIVGDLTAADVLPRDSFDCIVLTQTLQFIYELRPAVAQLHAALKPGGVLLATVPGISQIDRAEDWRGTWYWSFSSASAVRLFAEVFDAGSVSVESHGNVFAAMSFLHGLALEEVPLSKLLVQDPDYPVIVTLRARRRPRVGSGLLGTNDSRNSR
jgi:SAM-dependent methyltransferase